MTDAELIYRVIDEIKQFALTTTYVDALDLAKQSFIANPNTHNDWDRLSEEYKSLNVRLAEAAIWILTGKTIQWPADIFQDLC